MTLPSLRNLTQIALVAVIFGAGAFLAPDWQIGTTPLSARHGWAGAEALDASTEFIASQPRFEPDGVWQADPKANVRLWKNIEKVLGRVPENVPQQVGDCTSFALKNALEATQASQIVAGKRHTWRPIFPPYSYGIGRVKILKGAIRGDGATGASMAEGAKQFGALFADLEGVPPYNGALARLWGAKPGPPQKWIDEGSKYIVRTAARVINADDCRDAVCNGYGVVVCSNVGFEGRSAFREQDGRMVARRQGSWSHAMCVDGYDGSASEPYWHILNSWGPRSCPAPIDDSPPGGFWITRKDMESMIRQGDTWAFSEFDGFPVQKLPDLFGSTPSPADRASTRLAERKTEMAL